MGGLLLPRLAPAHLWHTRPPRKLSHGGASLAPLRPWLRLPAPALAPRPRLPPPPLLAWLPSTDWPALPEPPPPCPLQLLPVRPCSEAPLVQAPGTDKGGRLRGGAPLLLLLLLEAQPVAASDTGLHLHTPPALPESCLPWLPWGELEPRLSPTPHQSGRQALASPVGAAPAPPRPPPRRSPLACTGACSLPPPRAPGLVSGGLPRRWRPPFSPGTPLLPRRFPPSPPQTPTSQLHSTSRKQLPFSAHSGSGARTQKQPSWGLSAPRDSAWALTAGGGDPEPPPTSHPPSQPLGKAR
ncbi:Hypothetical predicted protein [Marmota monax]|uniref:Uncharacterized protein n=1 Tax=Marmota monax TaxID=9995 RepID=A0A5E4BV93_MARMO|nr:Hypothetical predicted protein [Marmota monax]